MTAMTEAALTERRVLDSQRPLLVILAVGALVTSLLTSVFAITEGGDRGLFAVPVIVQSTLVLVAVPTIRLMRTGLRLDGMSMFLAWEFFRGCVTPVILQYIGSGERFWYRLGTVEDAAFVLYLGNLFFVVVLVTRALVALIGARLGQRAAHTALAVPPMRLPVALRQGRIPIRVFIGLGLVGMLLRFPTVGSVTGFLSGRIEDLQGNTVFDEGLLAYLANVLRPLFFVGLALALVRRRREGRRWVWLLAPIGIAIGFGLASYGLNRAVPAYVLLALAFAFIERSHRIVSFRAVSVTLGGLGAIFVLVGTLRQTLWVSRTGLGDPPLGVVPELQSLLAYGASPMQLAAALPSSRASNPFTVFAFMQQFLSPIPGLANPARFQNSSAVFNYVIYDRYSGRDQLLPAWFGSYLTFGVVGVVVTGVAVAMLLALTDILRRRLSSVIGAYGAAYLAIWVAQFGVTGVSVVEQNFVNFVLTPLVMATAAVLWRQRRRTSSPPRPSDDRHSRGRPGTNALERR